MTLQQSDQTGYALGYSETERGRLAAQATLLNPSTRRLLADAGVGPGMRVLDLGCGVGDVSLLAAELVGPGGAVVGVDRDPRPLATARERASAAGTEHVAFMQADLTELTADGPFDAVVGRLVLMYLADPAAGLRRVCRQVRPGGVVAFHEYDFTALPPCFPRLPLWERSGAWAVEALRRAGAETQMGLKLHQTFCDAGLPAPRLRLETQVETGADSLAFGVLAETVRSLLPAMERFGVATAAEVDVETLAHRLREEVVAHNGVVTLPLLVGAWTRLLDA